MVPLVLVLGLAALVVKTWPGWAKLLSLSTVLDSFVLLFWPGPLVNHLFQLLTVVSVIWAAWGLMIVIKWKSPGVAPAVALLIGGAIGTYCEVGMMFL
ncbi:MAG: hypothetical protein HY673_09300 [Chloroflexi bacterium]|nr:hypothetical protein [Chloroflexota bacterium]